MTRHKAGIFSPSVTTLQLKQYFDRVVLINLQRRPDRLAHVRRELGRCPWPFKEPEIFEAVDGYGVPHPPGWRHGPGAWGCMQSHQLVLERAIADGVESLLVMEDDICFADDFRPGIRKFLKAVPDDWDQLMIGGQHLNSHGKPTLAKPGIVRCTDCQRAHCHAVRGKYMRKLHDRLRGGGKYDGMGFNDWIMGGDPEMQLAHKVYAPRFFLVGQERSYSDIYGAVMPRRFWNPPETDLFVINLHVPDEIVPALRSYGMSTGEGVGRDGSLRRELDKIFAETKSDQAARQNRLRGWIKLMQWELGSDRYLFCTVSHPEASAELVRKASLWKVYEVTADSVSEALAQLPPKIRKSLITARQQLKGTYPALPRGRLMTGHLGAIG